MGLLEIVIHLNKKDHFRKIQNFKTYCVVRQWRFNQENRCSEFPNKRQNYWYIQPSLSFIWYERRAEYTVVILSIFQPVLDNPLINGPHSIIKIFPDEIMAERISVQPPTAGL